MLRIALLLLLAWPALAQDVKTHVNAGIQKLKDGDNEGAIAEFDKAIELKPDEGPLYRLRADAKQRMLDYDGALADLGVAVKGNDLDGLYRRGLLLRAMGECEKAIADFSAILDKAHQWVPGYLERAQSHSVLGHYKEALTDLEVAKYLLESNVQPLQSLYMARGRVYFLKGDLDAATADFDKAVELAPKSGSACFARAMYRHDAGHFADALADYRKALELDAGAHEYARLYLCLARVRQGEQDAARKELADYIDGREVKDDWFVDVASFLVGRRTQEQLFAAAKSDNRWKTRERLCEAHWYAGATALAAGDTDGARALLEQCVAAKVHSFLETRSAAMALKNLSKSLQK